MNGRILSPVNKAEVVVAMSAVSFIEGVLRAINDRPSECSVQMAIVIRCQWARHRLRGAIAEAVEPLIPGDQALRALDPEDMSLAVEHRSAIRRMVGSLAATKGASIGALALMGSYLGARKLEQTVIANTALALEIDSDKETARADFIALSAIGHDLALFKSIALMAHGGSGADLAVTGLGQVIQIAQDETLFRPESKFEREFGNPTWMLRATEDVIPHERPMAGVESELQTLVEYAVRSAYTYEGQVADGWPWTRGLEPIIERLNAREQLREQAEGPLVSTKFVAVIRAMDAEQQVMMIETQEGPAVVCVGDGLWNTVACALGAGQVRANIEVERSLSHLRLQLVAFSALPLADAEQETPGGEDTSTMPEAQNASFAS